MRSRLAALAATLLLGLAVLTSCSGSDEPSQEAAPAVDSSDETGTEPSEDDSFDGDVAAGEEITAEQLTDLMVTAFEHATTARLTMEMSAGGQDIEATGEADYTTDPMSMRLDLSGLGVAGDMTVVLVDDAAYVRLLARSQDYIKVDLDDPSNPMGEAFTGQLDPRAQAEVIEKGLQSATYVGEEEVQGETLDHYAAVVDSGAMLDQLAVGPAGEDALPEEIGYDLWFDADGLYRQMTVDLGAAAGEVLIRFEDWGTDVDIEAPPADQVTDMGSMTG